MSRAFEPIAVIGRGCVLPEASDPDALWRVFSEGRDVVGRVPNGRWRLDSSRVLAPAGSAGPDHAWSDRGGYVRGFETVFDPDGFVLPVDALIGLDPVFLWVLHAGREALVDAGLGVPARRSAGTPLGLVLGNLSYPSRAHAAFAEHEWLRDTLETPGSWPGELPGGPPDPRNRFSSGLPAHLAAEALGLGGEAFSLDAACASSLYAIKLACDRLHRGKSDLMLAGAVNCADDLLIHVGFSTLQAMSRTGRSRPFHRDADGLVPAEGAGIVVLKRLDDAVRAGNRIAGVIRGIGLSNDGREGGMLGPSVRGQATAMSAAYAMAGITPGDVSLLECHATGTPIGDAIELESSATVFASSEGLPIGSHKSNFGHLVAAAGVTGLLKVLGAMQHRERPATLHAHPASPALDRTPFRVLSAPEPWECDGPLIASVSAFGFGGNNAHLIVEEHRGPALVSGQSAHRRVGGDRVDDPIVVVAADAFTALGPRLADLAAGLARPVAAQQPRQHAIESLELDLTGLRFPPNDLRQALPQQLLVLELAVRMADRTHLDPSHLGIYVGMGCDPLVSRYGASWRLRDRVHDSGHDPELLEQAGWLQRARQAIAPDLTTAALLGGMPNIPANRINSQLEALGPSFTVSAEQLSGIRALEIAATALTRGEIEVALVGAVDFCCEPAHQAAAEAVLATDQQPPGDAGVMLVLKRLTAALDEGDEVLAVLDDDGGTDESGQVFGSGEDAVSLTPRIGHAHAASGLAHVVAGVLAVHERLWCKDSTSAAVPWLAGADRNVDVRVEALGGQEATIRLLAAPSRAASHRGASSPIEVYRGASAEEVRRSLRSDASGTGDASLAIVVRDKAQAQAQRARAEAFLAAGDTSARCRVAPGIYWSPRPVAGQLAFVFTGAAAAYPGMGAPLLGVMPNLIDEVLARFPVLQRTQRWLVRDPSAAPSAPFEKLQGCTMLCQVHAVLSLGRLGLKPDAALGVSSGETNGVVALGAWPDLTALFEDIERSGMYVREVAGEYGVVRRAWGEKAPRDLDWVSYRVLEPPEVVEQAIGDEWRVRVSMVNAPADCIVSGPSGACRFVVQRLDRARVVSLGPDIVAHRPELEVWQAEWRRIHDRPTCSVPNVRFYANATGTWHAAERGAIADALTNQAIQTVDFRKVVEAAYRDGVRVFLEHGPRGSCSRWIGEILGDREHVAVSLDAFGAGVEHTLEALAELAAAGIPMTLDGLEVEAPRGPREATPLSAGAKGARLIVPAHWPEVRLGAIPDPRPSEDTPRVQIMEPAPALPPVLEAEGDRVFESAGAMIARVPFPLRPAVPLGTVANKLIEAHRGISKAHRAYLSQQANATALVARLVDRRPPVADLPQAPDVERTSTASVARTLGTDHAQAVDATDPSAGAVSRETITPRAAERALTRAQLEIHASGRISDVFGPEFAGQDDYPRQVRMPEPPLLLADRVLGIEGEPGSMSRGRVWTETDVKPSAWYLDRGYMPGGVMIEAGQADLLLISWLGVDAANRGERVYRLLGADLTFHGGLPRAGDTLRFDIRVVDYARQGDVTLFFFASECRIDDAIRLTVRSGQAGFFSDAELAASAGVPWSAEDAMPAGAGPLDPPLIEPWRSTFGAERVRAYAEGRIGDCFGSAYAEADAHLRTPAIPGGNLCLFDEIAAFDPRGGPWGRGYLRATDHVDPEAWHMRCHFKQDPCMPGTLMLEGGLQAMAFYLTAMGFTLGHDGGRFEPVPEQTYRLRCRGQVTPQSKAIEYELFVHEVSAGPRPTVYADVLGTVDGLRAFHCERLGLRLTPGFPLESRTPPRRASRSSMAYSNRDVAFDDASLLECAWGRLSRVFGERYAVFDGVRRGARLPGPPYDCISRVTEIESRATPGNHGRVVAEYDVPADAWYFEENGAATMPACVLLEIALQPCGCLAVNMGIGLESNADLHFRNLDGKAQQHFEVREGGCVVETRATCTSVSRVGDMTLLEFQVECFLEGRVVYEIETGFGFFTTEALRGQVGLPLDDPWHSCSRIESGLSVDEIELAARPARFFSGPAQLAGPMLCMLDRIVAFVPDGGEAGLGYLRAQSDMRPGKWFFKAHFFEDPVQPGSLGIEAVAQLLQVYLLATGEAARFSSPRFEPMAIGEPLVYKYRGQVTPLNRSVEVAAHITERGHDDRGAFVRARASLWVDGRPIYEVGTVGMRLVNESGVASRPSAPVAVATESVGAQVAQLVDAAQRRAHGGVVVGLRKGELSPEPSGGERLRARARLLDAGSLEAVLERWDEDEGVFRRHAALVVLFSDGYGVPDPPRRRGKRLMLNVSGSSGPDADEAAGQIGVLLDVVWKALRGAGVSPAVGIDSLRLHRGVDGIESVECWIDRADASNGIVRAELLAADQPLADVVLRLAGAEAVSGAESRRAEPLATPPRKPVDLESVRAYWRQTLGLGSWLGEDLVIALTEQFVEGVSIAGAEGVDALRRRGVVYLANHQVAIESLLFLVVMSALSSRPTAAVAKREHEQSWMGRLLETLLVSAETSAARELMVLVDRADAVDTWSRLREQIAAVGRGQRSLLIHAEGTRSRSARQPVKVLSSAIVDRCVEAAVPIVPVRFTGGLPIEVTDRRLDFPMGYGKQAWWLGAPIEPADLRDRDSSARRDHVLRALNATGPPADDERPHPGDPSFADAVEPLLVAEAEVPAVLRTLGERHGFTKDEAFESLLRALR